MTQDECRAMVARLDRNFEAMAERGRQERATSRRMRRYVESGSREGVYTATVAKRAAVRTDGEVVYLSEGTRVRP